jgi:hypothetical protein
MCASCSTEGKKRYSMSQGGSLDYETVEGFMSAMEGG